MFNSSVSVDKITMFSVRPPELRRLFRKVGDYYRWFHVSNIYMKNQMLEDVLDRSIERSFLIDGLQHQVCIRVKALPEIEDFLKL